MSAEIRFRFFPGNRSFEKDERVCSTLGAAAPAPEWGHPWIEHRVDRDCLLDLLSGLEQDDQGDYLVKVLVHRRLRGLG